MTRSRLHAVVGAALLLGGVANADAPVPPRGGVRESIAARVASIRAEVKRIDAADESADSPDRRHLGRDLPHWQLSGLFDRAGPLLLNATFTEGEMVRQEAYYLRDGQVMLVRIAKWWDVEDSTAAPEPGTEQDWYIEDQKSIQRVIKVQSKPPLRRVESSPLSAAGLVERAQRIGRILLGAEAADAPTKTLEAFPEADLPGR